jgi:hypothetical protein
MSPEPDTTSQKSFDQHAIVVTDSTTYKQLTFGRPDASLYPSVRMESSNSEASIVRVASLQPAFRAKLVATLVELPLQWPRRAWTARGLIALTEIAGQESKMFAGTNNRVLDSFYFRIGVLAVAFAAWAGVGYVLLALA